MRIHFIKTVIFFGLFANIAFTQTNGCPNMEFNRRYNQSEFNDLLEKCPSRIESNLWTSIKNSTVNIGFIASNIEYICTGLIIDHQYVLTAYHCLKHPNLVEIEFPNNYINPSFNYTVVKADQKYDRVLIKLTETIDNYIGNKSLLKFNQVLTKPLTERKNFILVSMQTPDLNDNFFDLNFIRIYPYKTDTFTASIFEFKRNIYRGLSIPYFNENDPYYWVFTSPKDGQEILNLGDSGSPVFTYDGNLVGLLVAYNSGVQYPELFGGKTMNRISKISSDWLKLK